MQTNRSTIRRHASLLAKGLHFGGLALFLGTIVSSVVIDRHIEAGELATLAKGRQAVSLISHGLIMPGLGLMALTGIAMSILRYGFRWPRWVFAKTACVVVIAVVAFSFLFPALDSATDWAVRSAQDNLRHPKYATYLARESGFGVVNLLLFLAAGALALWKPSLSPRTNRSD